MKTNIFRIAYSIIFVLLLVMGLGIGSAEQGIAESIGSITNESLAITNGGIKKDKSLQFNISTNRISQSKDGSEGTLVIKDNQGNTTSFSDYEETQKAPDGKVLRSSQGFADNDGKCLIEIVRVGAGKDISTYNGIQLIIHRVYKADGNLSERHDFFGNGQLRQYVIYRYSEEGKYLKGDIYDGKGHRLGSELTKPEAYMYGDRRKKEAQQR